MDHVDLSQPLETGMPVYPGSDPVRIDQENTVPAGGSRVSSLDFETHVGTHVDAPSHMLADGATLSDLPLSAFVFDARVVDCTGLALREPIGAGAVPDPSDRDMIVFRTGWERHWGTETYRDHPYLTEAAAAACATRGYSVGLDAFSPDPTPSADPDRHGTDEPTDQPAHDVLLKAERRIVENLTNLGAVPTRFRLVAYPLKFPGADGSPVRAVALPGERDGSDRQRLIDRS